MNKRLLKVKQGAQRSHFARRAAERLGYELASFEFNQIRQEVKNGVAELVANPERRLSLYRVQINSRSMIVVYDNETEEMVTLLTEEIWQSQRMCNCPSSKDSGNLKQSLGVNPVLTALKGKLKDGS